MDMGLTARTRCVQHLIACGDRNQRKVVSTARTKTEDTQVSNLGSPSITKNEDAQVSELGSPSFPETVTSMSMLTQSFMSQPLEIPTINVKVEDNLRNNDIPTVIMKLKK